jgi:HK97 family phage major capsid protein
MATKRNRQLATHRAELDGKRKGLVQEAHALNEAADKDNRLKTPAEKQRVDAILAELDENKVQVDAVTAEMDAEDKIEGHEHREIGQTGPEFSRARVIETRAEFRGFGELLQAIAAKSSPVLASRIPNAEVLLHKLEVYQAASGMSVGSPTDGGYIVRTDWSGAMLDRAREAAAILPLTRNIGIGADADSLEYPFIDETSRATGSRWGGVQVFWKSEAATVTAKAPKIGKGELRLEEIMGLAYATERLLRDGTALEGIVTSAFESEFAFTIDNAIMRGSGAGQPLGFFLGAGGTAHPAYVEVAKEGSQVAATVVAANVTKMYARMPARLKSGAVWLIHTDVMTQLPLMVIGQQPVWLPPGNLTQAPNGLLLGKPVIEIEQAEALGTAGDILFVNLGEYVTITKAGEGLRADSSMHVRFLYDEMAFRWVYRINGQPTWKTSLTPFKGALNSSPFIGLATRS